jgi:ribonuclease HI
MAIRIYVDGACSGNPGPGGWAALLVGEGVQVMQVGNSPATTNNQMELEAIRGGLEQAKPGATVIVVSDSANAIGWMTGVFKRKDPYIRETCEKIDELVSFRHLNVTYEKVLGHSDNVLNDRVNAEAQRQCKSHPPLIKIV